MTTIESLAALVARVHALEAIIAEYCPGCDPEANRPGAERQMHSSQCDDLDHVQPTSFDIPDAESIATLARQAEIGALVEAMPEGTELKFSHIGPLGQYWLAGGFSKSYGNSPLGALRAALAPQPGETK